MQRMREVQEAWYAGYEAVFVFGSVLLEGGRFFGTDMIGEADNLLAYFEKPWHWDRQHAWWVSVGRPMEVRHDTWDAAEANDWETDE